MGPGSIPHLFRHFVFSRYDVFENVFENVLPVHTSIHSNKFVILFYQL